VQVTEVRIKLMEQSEDRLRAFCSITLDHAFVVRDLKIIDGSSGPFVAMPSRKLSGHCPRCGYKNHLRAAYCNQCGVRLRIPAAIDSPQKLYADVAHPINSECREMISSAVLTEFQAELMRSHEPGYRPRYDDEFEAISETDDEHFTRIDLLKSSDEARPTEMLGEENASQAARAETTEIAKPSPREMPASAPPPHLSTGKDSERTRSKEISNSQGGFGSGIFE
jgi:stage V sporulation protein G